MMKFIRKLFGVSSINPSVLFYLDQCKAVGMEFEE